MTHAKMLRYLLNSGPLKTRYLFISAFIPRDLTPRNKDEDDFHLILVKRRTFHSGANKGGGAGEAEA